MRLVQLDGSLPNLALMRLHAWCKREAHTVTLTRSIYPMLNEPEYDEVWASAIFQFSRKTIELFRKQWPDSVVGGTGSDDGVTVESMLAPANVPEEYCYDGYPAFYDSIGFTQRGCRLSCKFCVVPQKEGKPKSMRTIREIWRGEPYPKRLHLLDNDFFGQPEWRERLQEIRDGRFRVCLSQGINVRMITEEAADALASIQYRDTKFTERKLYTAWDNLRDEEVFFTGVDRLERAGVPAKHLRAYMLIGYDKSETWTRIWYRFKKMVDRGVEPYPMPYDRERKDLLCFQRYVVTGLYRIVPFNQYERNTKTPEMVDGWKEIYSGGKG